METKTTFSDWQLKRVKTRETQLHSMGFSRRMFGFGFQNFFVNTYQIEFLHDIDWNHFMEYVTTQIASIKQKLSVLTTDKEKLQIFMITLSDITGPEVRGKGPRDIVELAGNVLKDLRDFIQDEIKKLPDDTTAAN